MPGRHSVFREGIIAGTLGATAVALWFLIVDTVSGRPFHTPTILGTALLGIFGPTADESVFILVASYTVFHYAAFCAVGIVLSLIVHQAETEPAVLAGLLILFVAFETGFYGLSALLSQEELLGNIAWYQIAAGNLVATLAMGVYMWRTHPSLGTEFEHALGGTE